MKLEKDLEAEKTTTTKTHWPLFLYKKLAYYLNNCDFVYHVAAWLIFFIIFFGIAAFFAMCIRYFPWQQDPCLKHQQAILYNRWNWSQQQQ
jgi:hypothetical protein